MTTYTGAQPVEGGYYLNTTEWKLEMVRGPGGALPGEATMRYYRVPLLGMLVVAPLMGLVFVVLMPFLGLAVMIEQGWRKALPHMRRRHAAATELEVAEAPAPAPTTTWTAGPDLRR
jgi:hypothetical protein